MTKVSETVGLIVAVFAALGFGLGLAGYVSISWGHSVFVASASGPTAERFGPLFVSVVYFQNVSAIFFVGLITSLVSGLLFGSNFLQARNALLATGGGTIVGFWMMALVALVIMSLGMGEPRGFGLFDAFGQIALAGIPAGIVGSVAGYLGAVAN